MDFSTLSNKDLCDMYISDTLSEDDFAQVIFEMRQRVSSVSDYGILTFFVAMDDLVKGVSKLLQKVYPIYKELFTTEEQHLIERILE